MNDIVYDGIGFNPLQASSMTEEAFVDELTPFVANSYVWDAKTPQDIARHLKEVHTICKSAIDTLAKLQEDGNNGSGISEALRSGGSDSRNGGSGNSEPKDDTGSEQVSTDQPGGGQQEHTAGTVSKSGVRAKKED